MMLAHIIGIPVEEGVLQLAPAGAATVTAIAIAGRTTLGRLRRRRPAGQSLPSDRSPRPPATRKRHTKETRDEFRPDRS
jgi:hypothetical protein